LQDVSDCITPAQRNERIRRLRLNRKAADAIRRRLLKLYTTDMRRSGVRGEQRMAQLEERALADEKIISTLDDWRLASPVDVFAADLLVAVIANYELELEGREELERLACRGRRA
jgi:hypothetical protein